MIGIASISVDKIEFWQQKNYHWFFPGYSCNGTCSCSGWRASATICIVFQCPAIWFSITAWLCSLPLFLSIFFGCIFPVSFFPRIVRRLSVDCVFSFWILVIQCVCAHRKSMTKWCNGTCLLFIVQESRTKKVRCVR